MIYLGTLGRMIGIKCPASQNVEHEERYTFQTTLEGRRRAQVRPRGPRTWSLQTSDATTPEQGSALQQFAHGAWGPGPFVFVSADAQHTNLLPPKASICDPSMISSDFISQGGPAEVYPGVWAGNSYLNASTSASMTFYNRNPIRPAIPVTGSAWVLGQGMRVYVSFWDEADKFINSASSTEAGSSSGWQRLSVTRTPPPNAVRASLYAVGAGRGTMPALTWTAEVQPWSAGNGCEKAVVHQLSNDLKLSLPGATYSSLSFTVTEVG